MIQLLGLWTVEITSEFLKEKQRFIIIIKGSQNSDSQDRESHCTSSGHISRGGRFASPSEIMCRGKDYFYRENEGLLSEDLVLGAVFTP